MVAAQVRLCSPRCLSTRTLTCIHSGIGDIISPRCALQACPRPRPFGFDLSLCKGAGAAISFFHQEMAFEIPSGSQRCVLLVQVRARVIVFSPANGLKCAICSPRVQMDATNPLATKLRGSDETQACHSHCLPVLRS
jgi:hypothetical protein